MFFYSPLRYPGGKNCIFGFVAGLLHENKLEGSDYAEPFAGGAGLALRLLFEEYVNKIYINDLDPFIYAFWRTVCRRPTEFCDWVENVEVSIDTWRHYKALYNRPVTRSTQLELAQTAFFLNRTNVSGVIKGGVIGGVSQKGNYKIDARFPKGDLIKRIQKIASYRERIIVSNDDGIDFVSRVDKNDVPIFIYLDPPYYKKGADLYMNFYTESNHQMLAQHVSSLKNKWMVSYDAQPYIFDLYRKYMIVKYQLSQCTSNRTGDEILIFKKVLKTNSAMHLLTDSIVLRARNKKEPVQNMDR